MPVNNATIEEEFVARMLELTARASPWNRRLWRTSTIKTGEEMLVACQNQSIPAAALKEMADRFGHGVHSDQALRELTTDLKQLLKNLSPGTSKKDHLWNRIHAEVEHMRENYLLRWAKIFKDKECKEIEGTVRRITSYILDSGMHKNSLHVMLKNLSQSQEPFQVTNFLVQIDEFLKRDLRTFTFCVPLKTKPKFTISHDATPGWLDGSETAAWRKENAPNVQPVRRQGSFLIEVKASDFNSALDVARAEVFNLRNRFSFGAKKEIIIEDQMISKEKNSLFDVNFNVRKIDVCSVERLECLGQLDIPDFVSRALTLAQPLKSSPAHIAIPSAWSAIESLLVSDLDEAHTVAARRFALIVSSSLIRAELTQLAWTYVEENDDELSNQIENASSNVERVRIFGDYIISGESVVFSRIVDNMALSCIIPMIHNPYKEIDKSTEILEVEFLRLYRKRNIISHGGEINEAVLAPTLDLVSPLVGAGLDRIVYVGLKYGKSPIELSANLEMRTDLLKNAGVNAFSQSLDLFDFS